MAILYKNRYCHQTIFSNFKQLIEKYASRTSAFTYLNLKIKTYLLNSIVISIDGVDPIEFFGGGNAKFKLLQKAFPSLNITARGSKINVAGEDDYTLNLFKEKVAQIKEFIFKNDKISFQSIENLLSESSRFDSGIPSSNEDIILYGAHKQKIRAKTPNQKSMVDASSDNDIMFAIGPAGTGKTYTAVALAVRALKEKQVKRIILTRPAVEAGENLGFLPGDLKEKIDPYLRPLYDALDDMIPPDKLKYYLETRVIEIAPLAFMRGRTLNNAFIILDEAQNATSAQLKMFLTRIGPIAKCIITGDLTQIDLPQKQESGLGFALNILKNIQGIATIYLDQRDVIRHRLVKDIIQAYDKE